MWADTINALFECFGGVFVSISILKLLKQKRVRGVSWITMSFFASWGAWNLVYYPSLGQWHSFYGGIFVFIANTVWVITMIYYECRERREKQSELES